MQPKADMALALPSKLKLCNNQTSTCGCNNNTIFPKDLFSRFVLSTYAGHVDLAAASHWGDACQSGKMATLFNSLFFVLKISLRTA